MYIIRGLEAYFIHKMTDLRFFLEKINLQVNFYPTCQIRRSALAY